MAITSEVKDEISRQLTVQITPSNILSSLRVQDPTTVAKAINPIFKSRDIYNLEAQLRNEALGPLTPIQALIRELDQGDWTYELQKHPITNQITHLFFVKGSSQDILKANHEALIMDCTYKTNKYKMPLLIISGQTALNTTFYLGFAFIVKEKTEDYTWVLTQLKALYAALELPNPIVMTTDMERSLMIAIRTVFPATNHLLCLWHINNNVLANCKKAFNSKESWEAFFADWKTVVYAISEREYERVWIDFNENNNLSHGECLDYLFETYVRDYRRRFIKCYTNKVLDFETTVTSRGEGGHVVLKRHLGVSSGDLKLVVDAINLLLINQHHNYLIAYEEAKIRYPTSFRLLIFH